MPIAIIISLIGSIVYAIPYSLFIFIPLTYLAFRKRKKISKASQKITLKVLRLSKKIGSIKLVKNLYIKTIFRYIGFVYIWVIAVAVSRFLLLAIVSLFFEWQVWYLFTQQFEWENLGNVRIIFYLTFIPCYIFAYKISHKFKPSIWTNKKFIRVHYFFFGIGYALEVLNFLFFDPSANIFQINYFIQIGVLTLMIKDRKYNLFNMGGE